MVNDPVPRAQSAAVAPQAPGAVAAGAQVLGVEGVPAKQFHRRGWYGDGLQEVRERRVSCQTTSIRPEETGLILGRLDE